MAFDDGIHWKRTLTSTIFNVRATEYTKIQHTPAQLIFGLDLILNICHEANWQLI